MGHLRSGRLGHEKSRNGCLTCKIRKVKCDETLPYCRKCTDTGRKCEGPVAQQIRFVQNQASTRSTNPIPQPEISLLIPHHDREERRTFHYFMHYAAPKFAGTNSASFWQTLVPRLAQTYDFVWDVVICLTSLVEHVPYSSLTSDSTGLIKVVNREHRQALKLYNGTIAYVRRLIEANQIDEWLVVLSCILFASVEFQQRNVRTGTDLIKRTCKMSTKILMSSQAKQNTALGQDIHQVVTPFVMRKAVTIATLGNGLPFERIHSDEASSILDVILSRSPSLNAARAQFYDLIHECYELIRVAEFIPVLEDDDFYKTLFFSQRQRLMEQMVEWKASFTAITSQLLDLESAWIASYISMYWAITYITLATCISYSQTNFDGYIDIFAEIMDHAGIYLKYGGQSAKIRQLSNLGPGALPPLYFCAMKCRDPILRREALHLMRQVPRHESPWAFIAPDRVAAKVISVEQGGSQLRATEDSPDSQEMGLPPEERRFAFISVVARQTPGGKQLHALELNRFEVAHDGSSKMINEYVWLDDVQDA